MQQPGWISSELFWVEKPVPKFIYCMTLCVCVHVNSWRTNFEKEQVSGYQELRGEREINVVLKVSVNSPWAENVPSYVNVNILMMIAHYNFARSYHRGALGKGCRWSSFCIISYSCIWIYNYFKLILKFYICTLT